MKLKQSNNEENARAQPRRQHSAGSQRHLEPSTSPGRAPCHQPHRGRVTGGCGRPATGTGPLPQLAVDKKQQRQDLCRSAGHREGSSHRHSLGATSAAITSGTFRPICLIAGKSALALPTVKVFTKGWEKGWGIKRRPEEVSLRTQLSPPSEADPLPRLEVVPFLGRRSEPELNPIEKLIRPSRARSILTDTNIIPNCSHLLPLVRASTEAKHPQIPLQA